MDSWLLVRHAQGRPSNCFVPLLHVGRETAPATHTQGQVTVYSLAHALFFAGHYTGLFRKLSPSGL